MSGFKPGEVFETNRPVTGEDLEPAGWMCESCPRPFVEGDLAYGTTLLIDSDTTHTAHWRCAECAA